MLYRWSGALPVCLDNLWRLPWRDRGGPAEALVADQRGQSRLDLHDFCAVTCIVWTCMFLLAHSTTSLIYILRANTSSIYVYIGVFVHTLEKHINIWKLCVFTFLYCTPHFHEHLRLPDSQRCTGVEMLRYSIEVRTIKCHQAVGKQTSH